MNINGRSFIFGSAARIIRKIYGLAEIHCVEVFRHMACVRVALNLKESGTLV